MLNESERLVIYLDPETLKYLFLSYTKARNYPVMNKLFGLLKEGYEAGHLVTPICFDHIVPFIQENKIDPAFLSMMGSISQTQFYQRFTIRTLQLIRVINYFFDIRYVKPVWRDAFSSDPDEKTTKGFNKYLAYTAQNVQKAIEREKNNSQVYFFFNSFKEKKPLDNIAPAYFNFLWEQFPDLIRPSLPADGTPDYHIKKFLEFDGIREIPEFHIIANILYPLFETFGISDIELGVKDDLLLAAETVAAYMPYCHYYVTTVDIAELLIMTRINEPYNVAVYDHNESSLYRLITDVADAVKNRRTDPKRPTHSMFKRDRFS